MKTKLTAADSERLAAEPKPDRIFPYVVPKLWLESPAEHAPEEFVREIGHGLYVTIVEDCDGLCRTRKYSDLGSFKKSIPEWHLLAGTNLCNLAAGPAIGKRVYVGPEEQKFAVWYDHWLAASCVRVPLLDFAKRFLEGSDFLACIPHREAMLIFPKREREYRDKMRAVIREKESDGRKPLSVEFFELTSTGPKPFSEDA